MTIHERSPIHRRLSGMKTKDRLTITCIQMASLVNWSNDCIPGLVVVAFPTVGPQLVHLLCKLSKTNTCYPHYTVESGSVTKDIY